MWPSVAVLVGRLIFAAVFFMPGFQIRRHDRNCGLHRLCGVSLLALPRLVAAIFEVVLSSVFMTGAFFAEVVLLAAVYVLFLALAFHGPSHWEGNQMEFGSFVDHFTFIAGLLFAAVHGPGQWSIRRTLIGSIDKRIARMVRVLAHPNLPGRLGQGRRPQVKATCT